MATTQQPFLPRVLRSDAGSVAVEVAPADAPAATGFTDLYQLVVLGPDGRDFLALHSLPRAPGAMYNQALLHRSPHVLRWRELT